MRFGNITSSIFEAKRNIALTISRDFANLSHSREKVAMQLRLRNG